MRRRDDVRVWVVVGALGAMALGIVLIPLRTVTSASNLAFVFLAFTIVVAELGGRAPALATAVVSAMSLNFFLTEPYLTMAIAKSDDLLAFLALAGCGLIAAAFGKRRERWAEVAGRAGGELDVLRRLVEHLAAGRPLEEALDGLRQRFVLDTIVLRDGRGRVVAAVPRAGGPAREPETKLALDTLLPGDDSRLQFGARGLRLPEGGVRLGVGTGTDALSLDLWGGDPEGFDLDETRTLALAASILGLATARRQAA